MNKIFSQNTWPDVSMISESIAAALSPEKIYLLSLIHQRKEIQSIFVENPLEHHMIEALNILVLIRESERRPNEELQDIIEHRLSIQIPVTAFVMQFGQFDSWLKKDHPFALKVIHHAKLYYDAGNIPLAAPDENNELAANDFLVWDLEQKTNKAVEFLAGADLFIVRNQFEMATFHLHQAAEQIYSGIIRFTTGFEAQTHNMDKLYRYSKYLLPDLKNIFPRDTELEKKLFQCLQKAYLGGRYDTDYSIKYTEVSQLVERIKKLLILCQGIKRTKLITA
jgi:HEPN domain-containing protein